MLKLKRYSNEPIFINNPQNEWEAAAVYNVAAIKENDVVHMFYRATDKNSNGRECSDYLNYIGHATSNDGIHFERDSKPVFGPSEGQETRGCEDPRVVKIEDKFYMLYTGFGGRFGGDFRICMAESSDLVHWEKKGVMLEESNKDASFFPKKIDGKYVLIHRRSPHIWISYSDDMIEWTDHKILAPVIEDNEWENFKIGLAGPPVETEKGYVLFYHGVSNEFAEVGRDLTYRQYSLGVMLLDKDDPSKVIYRQKEPILVPELDWEKYDGFVPNVVFSCGQVVMNDKIYVYYGGADNFTGLATCDMSEIDKLFDNVK